MDVSRLGVASRLGACRELYCGPTYTHGTLPLLWLASPQAAFVPHAAPRLAPVARKACAPVMAVQVGDIVRPRVIASAALAVPTLAAATPALALDTNDLILPVGGLTVLLTFILSFVIGYTVLGDGPANPTK